MFKRLFGISCTCDDGRTLIIEMQKGFQEHFRERAVLNFMFDHDPSWPKDRYHSSYRLREDSTNEVMTEVVG